MFPRGNQRSRMLNKTNNASRRKHVPLDKILLAIGMFLLGFQVRSFQSIDKNTPVSDISNQVSIPKQQPVIPISSIPKEPTRNVPIQDKKHWCVIALKHLPNNTRKYFQHFPHAAEILLPCWSWFMEQGATDNCGFALHYSLELSSWSRQLVDAMGCEVQKFMNPKSDLDERGYVKAISEDEVQYTPNMYLLRPRLEYIRYLNDASHAHALRRKFISDDLILSKKGPGTRLQIGMIQRLASRTIGNFDEIKEALQQELPDADIITTNFEFNTVREQAEWFATKDVIIAAHGAALTNAVFITEGTIIMQLYPPKYFWQSLDPLIEQSGGRAIQWYQKGQNPIVVSANLEKEEFDIAGKATFSPPVDEVILPVLYSLGEKKATLKLLEKLYGHFV